MSDEKIELLQAQLIDVIKDIKKLEDKVAMINILANAKAIIIPEEKAILWTNKIEVLEKKLNGEIESKLSTRIKTLNRMDSESAKVEQELKKKIETLEHIIGSTNFYKKNIGENLDILYKQLSELKGDFGSHRETNNEAFLDHHNHIINIEKGLREFLEYKNEWIKDVFVLDIDKYVLTKAQKWHLVAQHIHNKELLKKLNAQQTDEDYWNKTKFVLVEREHLREWNGKIWDAVENTEFDIEVFEELGRKIEMYLSEEEQDVV